MPKNNPGLPVRTADRTLTNNQQHEGKNAMVGAAAPLLVLYDFEVGH